MPQMRFGMRRNGMKWSRLKNGVASGHVAVKSNGLDQGRSDVSAFMLIMGALAGLPTVKLQGCDTNVDGDFVDLEGTGVTIPTNADNGVFLFEIVRPVHRYNRLVLSPDGTNDYVVDSILGCTYNNLDQPVASDGLHDLSAVFTSPGAGTA